MRRDTRSRPLARIENRSDDPSELRKLMVDSSFSGAGLNVHELPWSLIMSVLGEHEGSLGCHGDGIQLQDPSGAGFK